MTAGLGRQFNLVLACSALSAMGGVLSDFALALIITQVTGSAVAVGSLATITGLFTFALALPAGALVDRWDRRRALRNVHLVRASSVGVLLTFVAWDATSVPLLMVLAAINGGTTAFWQAASLSIISPVTRRTDLTRATSRVHVGMMLAGIVGPSLAGLLAPLSIQLVLLSAMVLLVAASATTLFLSGSFRAQTRSNPENILSSIGEGLLFVWKHPVLRPLACTCGIFWFAVAAKNSIIVLFLLGPGQMGMSASRYGLLLTAQALAGLGAATVSIKLERALGRERLLLACSIAVAGSSGVLAFTRNVYVVGAALTVGLFSLTCWMVVLTALTSRLAPDSQLARTHSMFRFIALGSMPLGALLGGLLGEFLSLEAVFASAAIVGLLATLALLPIRMEVGSPDGESSRGPEPRLS